MNPESLLFPSSGFPQLFLVEVTERISSQLLETAGAPFLNILCKAGSSTPAVTARGLAGRVRLFLLPVSPPSFLQHRCSLAGYLYDPLGSGRDPMTAQFCPQATSCLDPARARHLLADGMSGPSSSRASGGPSSAGLATPPGTCVPHPCLGPAGTVQGTLLGCWLPSLAALPTAQGQQPGNMGSCKYQKGTGSILGGPRCGSPALPDLYGGRTEGHRDTASRVPRSGLAGSLKPLHISRCRWGHWARAGWGCVKVTQQTGRP